MTVSTLYAPLDYTGSGAALPENLAVSWEFWAETDLVVTEVTTATGAEVVKTLATHYTVTGGSGSTGVVNPVAVRPSGVSWTISRATAMTQGVDLTAGTLFSAESVEDALDRLTHITQDHEERLDRTITLGVTDAAWTGKLPVAADRVSKSFLFDAAGEPIAGSVLAVGTLIVTSFIETLLDDATAAAARTTLGVSADAAGLSYSNTTSGLAATDVQAAIDERIHTLTKKTSDTGAVATETVVAELTNITIPGTPDGARAYRAVGQLLLFEGGAANRDCFARVRVGTAGDVTDAVLWEGACTVDTDANESIVINIPYFVPAASTKLSVTFWEAVGTSIDLRGDATVLESYIDIARI